ncbi:MAG: hypothetical protein HY581_02720 [Nitrospirae bacterium]|nr:hypothetical protein [Nitrospirota bacterium]
MRRWKDISHAVGLAVVFLAGLFAGETAQAGEFRWIASEMMPPKYAIWQPNQLIMDQEDLKDGLTFILENPTKEEHAFAVRGMFEVVTEKSTEVVAPGEEPGMVYHLKPIRVTVRPGETKRINVSTAQFEGSRLTGPDQLFRVWCPLHKDRHLGGHIYYVGR